MKKAPIILVAVYLIATLTACGSGSTELGADSNAVSTSTYSEATQNTSTGLGESLNEDSLLSDNQSVAKDNDSNILVAYFTHAENSTTDAVSSATLVNRNGNDMGAAEVLADMIAKNTNADLFSIQTDNDYPFEYNDLADYAKSEQDNDILPNLATHIENFDQYDTVFVVFPVWWYTMPQAMFSFFEEYDFSGKTIIPATTHLGSRLAGSPATISDLEPNADVISGGFEVSADKAADAENDVKEWLAGLGF